MKAVVILLTVCFFSLNSISGEREDKFAISGGIVKASLAHRELPPSSNIKELAIIDAPSWSQRIFRSNVDRTFDHGSILSLLVIDDGKILYERYREPATINTKQFSWSMAKSLTAYTIGQLLCEGKIGSLEDRAEQYVPVLADTTYGKATIRNLLTMSSGGPIASNTGYVMGGQGDRIRFHTNSMLELANENNYHAKRVKTAAGKEFMYDNSNSDTLALIAQATSGFLETFDKTIWKAAGTESSGSWLLDKDQNPIGSWGFSATTRDWARLALHTIEMLNSENKCIKDYMRQATTPQIKNPGTINGQSFSAYGFQTWTSPKLGDSDSFWWIGYMGQRIGINPKSNHVIVVSGWKDDSAVELHKLFGQL